MARMSWGEVFARIEGQCWPTYQALLEGVQQYRPDATRHAVYNAWRRLGKPGKPSDLVGDPWSGEETTPSSAPVLEPCGGPQRPNIWIEPPDGPVVIPGDIHFPIHDPRALDCMFALVADLQPAAVILQGDTFDLHYASRFATEHQRMHHFRLADELAVGRKYLEALASMVPQCHAIMGNHEGKRWQELLDREPWLYQLGGMDIETVCDYPDGWTVHPWKARLRFDHVAVEHGDALKGSGSKYGSARVVDTHPTPGALTIYGHTHRINDYRKTYYDHDGLPQTTRAVSCGHLSDLRWHGYASEPNWQQGLVVLAPLGGGLWDAHAVEIKDGRCTYGGKVYGR